MRRAERLLQLLQILRRHRVPVTADVIASELEVSLRTVYRDMASLIGERVPIRGEAGIGYVLDGGFDMPPLMFTVDELEAAMLGLRWVARNGDTQLSRAARDAVAKIGAVLPDGLKPYLFDASLVVLPRSWVATDAVDVGALRAAIRDGRKVAIRYHNEADEVTERIIWPLGVAYFEATRNIIAWCELREAFRYFRTDRIEQISYPGQRYPGRRKALLKSWQEKMRVESAMPDLDVFS
jgi:predicted DNA-binding transcriptional regulator YafY